MTIFDVGANVGIYTLIAASRVGASGAVHAFEPVPELLACLATGVHLSRAGNVALIGAAVADDNDFREMYLGEGSDSDIHSLAPSERRPRRLAVPCLALDDYAARRGIRSVDLLKIDVEGAELPALRGAARLLSGPDAPILQVELCEANFEGFGYTSRVLKEHLAGLGYAGYRFSPSGEGTPVPEPEPHPRWENLLFLKPVHYERLPDGWRLARRPAGG